MFILTKVADLVQIAPDDFRKQSHVAIEDNINAKYANKASSEVLLLGLSLAHLTASVQVVQRIGLCICLWDILWTSEGLIGNGDGMVNVNVVTDFYDDIFVPWTELPDGSEFEPSENLWVWRDEDQVMYFDNNEMVRFKVISEEWHDQTPSKPVEAAEGAEEEPAPTNSKPPYQIVGSMNGPGLGCCLWWE
ncbi:hypothetical protein NEMBOFW57_002224 [Staphylotrichum longicolle]|uniref:DNA-directed RNA polymerase subunit n=1 Tax=Staphylotrichum longicolle TaxID=669026 RepID=A0AAD4HYI7_9PEZI|nr:hypothetical protein NEMBOFW57_002224 [Staphylotrichum longicolle]